MDFLKKHYEKVILCVVMLGLAAAAALLPGMVSSERQKLQEAKDSLVKAPPKKVAEVDLKTGDEALNRLKAPAKLTYSLPHNLFNPVKWMRKPDGALIPVRTGTEVGPGAVTVTKITPLNTIIAYEGVFSASEKPQYKFAITRQAEKTSSKQAKTPRSISKDGKCEFFVLKEVVGPPEDPTQFKLELAEDKQVVTVSKEKPYTRVAGHMADMKYDPEKLTFTGRRVGDKLVFAGDTNNVVAITETNVVLSAASTTKRTTLSAGGAQ
jgi:hypothetical protein